MKLIEKSSKGVPGEVTDVVLTPADLGANEATLAFTAPAVTAAGETLSEITAIDVYVNGVLEKTFDNPAPGEAMTYLDTEVENGFNTYRIIARNGEGEGAAVEASAFVGMDMPVAPANAVARLNNDMSITVTWDAPTQSVNGGYVDYSAITYRVERNSESSGVVAEGTSETSYTDNIPVTEGQVNASYTITPLYNGNEGESVESNSVVTGKPLDLPYKASFAWGEQENWPKTARFTTLTSMPRATSMTTGRVSRSSRLPTMTVASSLPRASMPTTTCTAAWFRPCSTSTA